MAFTHTMEIVFTGRTIEGEITFNHGTEATFKILNSMELSVAENASVQRLFERLVKFTVEHGEIEKIEILKIP